MAKIETLPTFTSAPNSSQMNDAFAKITTAMSNTLSRDGSTPNTLSADLDLNGNDLINVNTLDVTTLTLAGERVVAVQADSGHFYAKNFGAVEDYDQATQSGTDDTAAIQAALDYAGSEWAPDMTGGVVWIHKRSLITAKLVVPTGVKLKAVVPVSSYGTGGTAASIFPITYNEGSGIVASHLVGPAILLKRAGTGVYDLTIGATSARRNATISSGAQNRNAGILIETDDTPTAQIQRITVRGVLVRDQPADGIYGCGDLFLVNVDDNAVINCGGHGIIFDDGTLSGRTNKDRPGQVRITENRVQNTGGHIIAIGQVGSAALLPYRIYLSGNEGFRNGNTPSIMLKDAGYFILGEQVDFFSNAPGGSSGWTGGVATLAYAVWVAGRNVHFHNVRYIGWLTNPVAIGAISGVATRDVVFNGGYAATDASNSDYFAIVEAAGVRGLVFNEPGGDFDIAPVDVDAVIALSGGGYGEYTWNGEKKCWGTSYAFDDVSVSGFLNIGPRVFQGIVSGEITATSSRIRLGTEGSAASDDLRVINGGTDGDMLFLSTASASNDVTLKHRVGGTDNLLLAGEADVTLNNSSDRIWLIYRGSDSRWVQTAFSDNAS